MSTFSKLVRDDTDDGLETNYYLYYFRTERLRKVPLRVFINTQGPVFDKNENKVRVIDCTSRSRAYAKIKKFLAVSTCGNNNKRVRVPREFNAQSLFGDIEDMYLGSRMVIYIVKMLGKFQKVMENKGKHILVSLIKLFMEIYTLMTNTFNFVNFCQIILSIYSIHSDIFQAQSLDFVIMAGISALLPNKLAAILRSAQLLTQSKIGDDLSLINKLIAAVFNLCEYLMAKVPEGSVFKPYLDKIFGFFKNNTAHVWITQIEAAIKDTDKNPNKLNNESYRDQLFLIDKKLKDNPEITDWCRRSAALTSIITRWKNLMRIVIAHGQPDRQEPNCFVFEGPPGTMKSCVLSAVIIASGQTCYSHLVKSAMDGKDWYDSYNNEDIFFMDDVGQQGISQWRTIINMVSSVKMPLDCADASLKDTKFFNSPTIMVTTNQFQNMQGLTKQDCISDVKALWRRGYVFDFGKVVRNGNFITGLVGFKYFDINTDQFESSLPSVFKLKYPHIESTFLVKAEDVNRKLNLVSWVLSIVNGFAAIKNDFTNDNKLSVADIEYIKNVSKNLQLTGQFVAQVKTYKPEVYDEDFEKLIDEELVSLQHKSVFEDANGLQSSSIMSEIDVLDSFSEYTSSRDMCELNPAEAQGGIFSTVRERAADNPNLDVHYNVATERGETVRLYNQSVVAFTEVAEEPAWYDAFINIARHSKWCIEVLFTYVKLWIEDFFRSPANVNSLITLSVLGSFIILLFLFQRISVKSACNDEIKRMNDTPEGRNRLDDILASGKCFNPFIERNRNKTKFFNDSTKGVKSFQTQSWRDDFKYPDSKISSSVAYLQKSVKEIDIIFDDAKVKGFCIVSGRHVMVPKHFVHSRNGVLVIYQDRDKNHILVDNESFVEEWSSLVDDIVVLALPKTFPSPFPNISNFFSTKYSTGLNCIVNSFGVKYIGANESDKLDRSYSYVHHLNESKLVNKIGPKDYTYTTQGLGLCGSIVVNATGGVLGMHVAGDPVAGTGVALKWSDLVREKIKLILDGDKNILPWSISNKVFANTSVVKLDRTMHTSVPSATSFGPSPLFGIYPVTREPAQLQVYGKCTVKDIAKKSFYPVVYAPSEEIAFGRQVIRSFLQPFDVITNEEVVKGNSLLAGLNKTSSNGFGCEKEKSIYVNFEEGTLTSRCLEEIEAVEMSIRNSTPNWDSFVWIESLKDELRNEEKGGVPRSFRIGTIHQQILMKRYFGQLVSNLIKTRDFHQIMVGINPFVEWPQMYDVLVKSKGVFAGDVKNWDGNMLVQVQRAAVEEIVSFFRGDKDIASFLLETLVHSLVAIQDDFYLTTHSMPSGSFLTAIFNSIVNKFYTAMWFYREMKNNNKIASVKLFWEIVTDYVYGDDKLNGVRKYEEFLNAITMRDFFRSFGMNLTMANKSEIILPFESIEEVSFLKRTFRYHNKLKMIVCPLELRTLFSGLSYVNVGKDVDVVMQDKLSCFQREIYLHPDREELLADLKCRLSRFPCFKCNFLLEGYLQEVYKDPNCILDNFMDVYI